SIRSIFQIVTTRNSNHEVVMTSARPRFYRPRNSAFHPCPALITSFVPDDIAALILNRIRARDSDGLQDDGLIAQLSPGVGRRFPFSAPLASCPGVSFRTQGQG